MDGSDQVMDILSREVLTPGKAVQVSEIICILGNTSEVTQVSAEQRKLQK